jgi:thiol:disulfide interchange protein DsbD
VKRLFLVTLAAIVAASVSAAAQLQRPKATLTPFVDGTAAPGSSIRLGVKVALAEGLHTQSNAPRDPALIATKLTIDTADGVTIKEIVWPTPRDFVVAGIGQPLAVFDHEFPIGIDVALANTVARGPLRLTGHLKYQACNDSLCFPPTTTDVEWPITVAAKRQPATDAAAVAFFRTIAFGSGVPPAQAASAESKGAQAAAPPIVTPSSSSASDAELLNGFTVLGTAGGYLGTSDFLTFIRNSENGVQERGMFEGRGPIAILLLVLIGGLALNLTPCVLPMIPINLAIIGAGTRASSRGRGLLLGSAYGAAMAAVYGVLGLLVILTAGTFGTINASPWFNLGIALLFVVLGLAMFDVLIIDFSKYSANLAGGGSRGSVMLAFTMGAVAALLAGACVAPVVIQVVLFSSNLYASGTRVALALPFVLGIGMALPWPIAGAGLSALPKPGAWMVRVKQAFGVFILLTAVYYGYEAYSLFANRWVDPATVEASVEEQLKAGWYASLARGLETSKREQKPVLIDMWATWCKNCLTMDKTTLATNEVQSALAGYVKIKYQAEDPSAEPAKSVLERFKAPGLPAYAIVRPK